MFERMHHIQIREVCQFFFGSGSILQDTTLLSEISERVTFKSSAPNQLLPNFVNRKVKRFLSDQLTKRKREAVVIPLPISMHTGQIILLTKMKAGRDLAFYVFSGSGPVLTVSSSQSD